MNDYNKFLTSYIDCALWASYDNDEKQELERKDISEQALAELEREAKAFFESHHDKFDGVEEQAGHDFWLTRNRHGARFWDRADIYGKENATLLTEMSHAYGDAILYHSDDGLIYFA